MSELIIGIDLGTTNSAVAHIHQGQPVIIPVDGEPTMPSCVGLSPDGTLLTGREARNQYTVYPERTILSVKRQMGGTAPLSIGGQSFRPEEVSALILKKLKAAAEAHLQQAVSKAVITVPAYFDEAQRKATRNAGEIAGLEVVNILNEPTAAALAYGSLSENEGTTLVYDLGGGTFDASLVQNEQGVIEVKSSHGDTQLGGDDFDRVLVREACEVFAAEHDLDLDDDPIAMSRLKIGMEAAKIRLSTEPFTQVEEAFLHDGKSLRAEFARSRYEDEIRPLLEKTIGCCAQCLNDANLRASQLDRILLVGGSSRTPLVFELLKRHFELEASHELDPDLVVAYGAALQAASIAGIETTRILLDITPHNLGIAVKGAYDHLVFSPLITRNTPLPASHSNVYFTYTDEQEACKLEIYQGAYETLEQNERIGDFTVTGLGKFPANNKIIVHFQLNLNGMLEVTATEKRTGLNKTVEFDTEGDDADLDITATSERLQTLAGDEPNKEPADDPAEATTATAPTPTDALKQRAEKLLAQDGLDADDRDEINACLGKIEAALDNDDSEALEAATSALEDILFFLDA